MTSRDAQIKEICEWNSLRYEDGGGDDEAFKCRYLEVFYDIIGSFNWVQKFRSVSRLLIVEQPRLCNTAGLSAMPCLRELWICCCSLSEIGEIKNLPNLEKLLLYDNQISQVDGLHLLPSLRVLWLNGNLIGEAAPLANLAKLEVLNLASNLICCLGTEIASLQSLESLNLSDNPIHSVSDCEWLVLSHLNQSHSLKHLSFRDQQYGACPFSATIHYTSYIIWLLPNLLTLDTHEIGDSNLKTLSLQLIERKRIYYHMMYHTLNMKLEQLRSKMTQSHLYLLCQFTDRLRMLYSQSLDMRCLGDSMICCLVVTSSKPDPEQIDKKQKLMQVRVNSILSKIDELASLFEQAERLTESIFELKLALTTLEFRSGGCFRVERGSEKELWFSRCKDLLLSRFCANEFDGCEKLSVLAVSRVYSRSMRQQFATATRDIDRVSLEYLFLSVDDYEIDALVDSLEHGFVLDEDIEGLDNGIRLTNSIALLHKNSKATCESNHRCLIVCKVCVNNSKSLQNPHMRIRRDAFEEFDSVYRSVTNDSCEECSTRIGETFVLNATLVLPEYIVYYELLPTAPTDPFCNYIRAAFSDESNLNISALTHQAFVDRFDDVDVLATQPLCEAPQSSANVLSLLSIVDKPDSIKYLYLHNVKLIEISIAQFTNLHTLVMASNYLSTVQELLTCLRSLKHLDLSFNKISTITNFPPLNTLEFLNLSCNNLSDFMESCSVLGKCCPDLTDLNLSFNPYTKKLEYLRFALLSFKALKRFNAVDVPSDAFTDLPCVSTTPQLILSNCSAETDKPKMLQILDNAQILHRMQLLGANEGDSNMQFSSITSLCLEHCNIVELSVDFTLLVNLKRVSLKDNMLKSLSGIEDCLLLEEVNVSGNCIVSLKGIESLSKLQMLNASKNRLTALEASEFDRLHKLRHLNVVLNSIKSIQGLQFNSSLQVLYLSFNRLENVRDLFCLKQNTHLSILSLTPGNPLTLHANYRSLILYHLQCLRALDCVTIEQADLMSAREMFGGKLTPDFVAEKIGHANFNQIEQLDVSQSNIRSIDLHGFFVNLRSLNLESNQISNVAELLPLKNLRVLCLNSNLIERLVPLTAKQAAAVSAAKSKTDSGMSAGSAVHSDDTSVIFPKLEVLHLAFNGIKDMLMLSLNRIPSLKSLFLQGNEILRIEGIEQLHELRELVLDRNRIKIIADHAFDGQYRLHELHIEDNRLRDLSGFSRLRSLQRLYVGGNKINNLQDLCLVEELTKLNEINMVNNPVCRRNLHRPYILASNLRIQLIDGEFVNDEDKINAHLLLQERESEANYAIGGFASAATSMPPNIQFSSLAASGAGITGTNPTVKVQNFNMAFHRNGQPEDLSSSARYLRGNGLNKNNSSAYGDLVYRMNKRS